MRPMCAVEGCGSESAVRGWCGKHYSRWRRHGDPLKVSEGREHPGVVSLLPPILSYRQLDYWIRLGLFTPRHPATPGSGHRRRIDPDEFEFLSKVAAIAAIGVTPRTAFRFARGETVDGFRLVANESVVVGG